MYVRSDYLEMTRAEIKSCHGLVPPDRGVLKRAASVPNDCYNSDY